MQYRLEIYYIYLGKEFVMDEKRIQNLGFCDLDTAIFKQLYNQAEVKPTSVQVKSSLAMVNGSWNRPDNLPHKQLNMELPANITLVSKCRLY